MKGREGKGWWTTTWILLCSTVQYSKLTTDLTAQDQDQELRNNPQKSTGSHPASRLSVRRPSTPSSLFWRSSLERQASTYMQGKRWSVLCCVVDVRCVERSINQRGLHSHTRIYGVHPPSQERCRIYAPRPSDRWLIRQVPYRPGEREREKRVQNF